MKKYLSFILAAAMLLSAAGCSSKKDIDSEPAPVDVQDSSPKIVNEPIQDDMPAPEDVFREYSREDFSEISVMVNISSYEPPIKTGSYEIKDFDVKKELPPCSEGEYLERFRSLAESFWGNPDNPYLLDQIDTKLTPTAGTLNDIELADDKLYFCVNRDNGCETFGLGIHSAAIYEYDLNTDKLREIFSYCDPDESFCSGFTIIPFKGTIWVQCSYNYIDIEERSFFTQHLGQKLFRLDPDKGTLTEQTFSEKFEGHLRHDPEHFIVSCINDDDADTNVYYEYDVDSDSWEHIEILPEYTETSQETEEIRTEKDDKRNIIVTTDNYTINTGLRRGDVIKHGNMLTVTDGKMDITNLNKTNCIYTFDFDTMELYKLDLSGIGEIYKIDPFGSGLLVSSNGNNITYLMPRQGAAFELFTHSYDVGPGFIQKKLNNGHLEIIAYTGNHMDELTFYVLDAYADE